MTAPFRIPALKPVTVDVAVEPVYSVLVSMAMLGSIMPDGRQNPARNPNLPSLFSAADNNENVDTWVVETALKLTPEMRYANRLLFEGLGDVLVPDRSYESFEAYLEALEGANPVQLRDQALRRIARSPGSQRDTQALLADSETFIAHMRGLYHNDPVDEQLLTEAHALLKEPAALHDIVVGHLRSLWDAAFQQEWKRRGPLLQALTTALRGRSLPESNAPEAIRAFVGQDLPPHMTAQLADVAHIVFVPSPHVRLFASRFGTTDTLWVFAATSTITGWTLRQAPIKPVEVLTRISPLADQTRLQILEMLAQEGELSSQDLIDRLGISQSGVSRHLKALGQYVVERRGEGASKHYRLNLSHLDWTVVTLRRFLTSTEPQLEPILQSMPSLQNLNRNARGFAPQPNVRVGPQPRNMAANNAPKELHRFMDADGRITGFPTKRKDVQLMLEYLAGKFEFGRDYSEKQVNAVLSESLHPHYNDFVTIRRELYNTMLLDRERDGSRYWRIEPTAEQQSE